MMPVYHLHVLSIPFDNDCPLTDRKDRYESRFAKSMQQLHEILNKNNILHRIRLNERILIAMPTNKMTRLISIKNYKLL